MSQSTRPRVLVVDDSPQFLALVGEDLAAEGYEVDTALSGEQCLQKVLAAPPNAILLDVSMPGLSGLETCIRLRSLPGTECVPVIFMTGHNAAEGSALAAVAAGGDDFIEKPYRAPILVARVAAHVQAGQRAQRLAGVDETGFAGFAFWRTALERELLRACRGPSHPGHPVAVAALKPRPGSQLALVRKELASIPGFVPRLDVVALHEGVFMVLLCDRRPTEALRAIETVAASIATGRVSGSDGGEAPSADAILRAVLDLPASGGLACVTPPRS